VSLQIAREKLEVNCGSLSDIIRHGRPNHGTEWWRYSLATPGPSIIFVQGMNLAALEHPWLTIVRMLLYPSDFGKSVIRSMDMYWKGPSSTCVSKCWRGAFNHGRFVFDSWHLAHPFTYSSTNSQSQGPSYDRLISSHVLAIPRCPPVGLLWICRRIDCHCSVLFFRKVFCRESCWGSEKRVSGRRTRGSSVFTPLLRSNLRDKRSETVFRCPGIWVRV
jgi:hypothetical protein